MIQQANGDQQRVNEKRLFHGTSPDSVEAICKENFDWRLSGTATGTKYGQGSYFAVKASHSQNYAKMPISLDLCSWPKSSWVRM